MIKNYKINQPFTSDLSVEEGEKNSSRTWNHGAGRIVNHVETFFTQKAEKSGVYVKHGTHPEPTGTCRNHPKPTRNHPEPSRNHPEPYGTYPEPPGTLTENKNNKN